ncbi:MAG: hypothetical protein FJW35_11060 [Acidobacteria bacterium]|nr:hypothetical protein [Acidobacteriota bacterium]
MVHEKHKALLMGFLDGELTEVEGQRVEDHLKECAECRAEVEDFRRLKEITQSMKLAMPEDKYWEEYWAQIYNRVERRAGWILLSVGAILLLSYGGYRLAVHMLFSPTFPVFLRVGVAAVVIGASTLMVSVIRERFFLSKADKYRRIKR